MTTFTTISDQEPVVSSELSKPFQTTDEFAHFESTNNFQTDYSIAVETTQIFLEPTVYLSFLTSEIQNNLQTVQEKTLSKRFNVENYFY